MLNHHGIDATTECESFHGPQSYSAVAESIPVDTPLRADIGEWIGVVIFLVITAVSYLSQLSQKAQQPAQRRAPPRPDGGARDAAEEVRQFLERAQKQRKAEAERTPVVQAEVVKAEMVSDRSARRPAWARDSVAEPLADSTAPSVYRGESVAEHVQQHIERDPLPHNVPAVDQADEQLESHLHKVFDHRLGSLGTAAPVPIRDGTDETVGQRTARTDASDDPAATRRSNPAATEIAKMLGNPQQIRQAVILGEILQRRDDLLK